MPTTVLCVDDSPTIRSLVRKTLEPEGFQVIEADNGQTALEKIRVEKPDLAIVDVNMPVMDGFAFVEAVKADSNLGDLPIIFLTTESSAEKKGKGKALGVNGWIVKPFEPESVVKIAKMFAG